MSEAFEAGVDAPAPDGPEEQEQDPRSAARAGAIEPVETEVEEDTRTDVERERDEYLDALRRLQADFENYRKRVDRQFEELAARGATALVRLLLPVLDALDLAEAHLLTDTIDDAVVAAETKALVQARSSPSFPSVSSRSAPARSATRSTPPCTTPSRTSRATTARSWTRCCAPGTGGVARCCGPRW